MPQRPHSVQSPFGMRAGNDEYEDKIGNFRSQPGKVFLVGAGPGDPGLITVRGAECLAQADLVLFDGLANAKLLRLAPHAEHVSVGKHGVGPIWSQMDINARLIQSAQAGLRVVRLKGGDPAVFARTAEELEALVAAGIAFEVVPGITAALAAASYVGIPITHRDHASAVAFITGQQQSDSVYELDWTALARFPGTLVFYMGVTTAGQWCQRLISQGKPATTPAAIVRRCSLPDQRVIRCRLNEVSEHLTPATKLRPPVIVIVGEVAAMGDKFNWFDARPLHQTGIWLTRPHGQNDFLEKQLSELGADVYVHPALEIGRPESFESLDRSIRGLAQGDYQGIAFTSRNAFEAVIDRAWTLSLDLRIFHGLKIACVGDKTAQYLASRGLLADLVPEHDFNAARLVELIGSINANHRSSLKRWLLPQADQARDTLASGLNALGFEVDRVTAYRTLPITQMSSEIRAAMERSAIQWVTVTSPIMARALFQVCQGYTEQLKPLSLSPAISHTLRELGWPAAAETTSAREEEIIEVLLQNQSG